MARLIQLLAGEKGATLVLRRGWEKLYFPRSEFTCMVTQKSWSFDACFEGTIGTWQHLIVPPSLPNSTVAGHHLLMHKEAKRNKRHSMRSSLTPRWWRRPPQEEPLSVLCGKGRGKIAKNTGPALCVDCIIVELGCRNKARNNGMHFIKQCLSECTGR